MDDQLAHIGGQLFGRPARLILAVWIAGRDDPVFYQGEAVHSSRLPQSNVREELGRLVDLGMLSDLPAKGSRRRYYMRTNSPLWSVVEAARSAVEALAATSTGRKA